MSIEETQGEYGLRTIALLAARLFTQNVTFEMVWWKKKQIN